MNPIYLTPSEIENACRRKDGTTLVQPAAQVRALRALGLTVKPRRDGTPLVSRANFERVFEGVADAGPKNDDDAEARQYSVGGRIGGNVVSIRSQK
jgi:hypothetical protein